MTFKLLAVELHDTAAAAEQFFRNHRGATHLEPEETVHQTLQLRPTLKGVLPDRSILCVEVSPRPYSSSLDTFVVEAFQGGWPIHLYVAVPDTKHPDFPTDLRLAKKRGVGVLLLGSEGPHIFHEAVSLSLFGLSPTNPDEFPRAKRQAVAAADETFRGGRPDKGCQSIYEDIEGISRNVAIYTRKKGFWRAARAGDPPVLKDLEHGSWARVLLNLHVFLEFQQLKAKLPNLRPGLIAATMDLTDPRNQTSHRPRNPARRRERDRRLREWFEHGRELLRRWCEAVKPLRLY